MKPILFRLTANLLSIQPISSSYACKIHSRWQSEITIEKASQKPCHYGPTKTQGTIREAEHQSCHSQQRNAGENGGPPALYVGQTSPEIARKGKKTISHAWVMTVQNQLKPKSITSTLPDTAVPYLGTHQGLLPQCHSSALCHVAWISSWVQRGGHIWNKWVQLHKHRSARQPRATQYLFKVNLKQHRVQHCRYMYFPYNQQNWNAKHIHSQGIHASTVVGLLHRATPTFNWKISGWEKEGGKKCRGW